jgi:NAD+ synthase
MLSTLAVDCERVVETIVEFIRDAARSLRRQGIVLGLSGGLDSTLVAALCVEALGNAKVTGLVLPDGEREGQPEKDAGLAARWLGIHIEKKDISRPLKALGAGSLKLPAFPAARVRDAVVSLVYSRLERKIGEDPFLHVLGGPTNRLVARGNAHYKTKHRMRMVAVYHYAETNNLLVAGAANKTEKLTGLFCKFGVDHCADIMPIGPLYRTQVVRVAEHMKVPEEILAKPPNPDMIRGMSDKYKFLTKLYAHELDAVLAGLESGTPPERLQVETGVTLERILHIRELHRRSHHMRHPGMEPQL